MSSFYGSSGDCIQTHSQFKMPPAFIKYNSANELVKSLEWISHVWLREVRRESVEELIWTRDNGSEKEKDCCQYLQMRLKNERKCIKSRETTKKKH